APLHSAQAMAAGAASTRNLGQARQERSVRAPRDAQWLARSSLCCSPDPTIGTIPSRRVPYIKALRASTLHLPSQDLTRYLALRVRDWGHHVEQTSSGSSLPVWRQLARLCSQSQRKSA